MKRALREVIREIVEEILDEAIRRQDYVDGMFNHMKGAFGEYLKARYAEANEYKRRSGLHGTKQGWDREAKKLIHFNFRQAASRSFKGGGQGGAFAEAKEELRKQIPSYLEWAKGEVAEAFGLDESAMDDPPHEATDEFFAFLDNEFESCFEPRV